MLHAVGPFISRKTVSILVFVGCGAFRFCIADDDLAVGRCQDFKKQQKGGFSSKNEKCHAYSKSKTKEDF